MTPHRPLIAFGRRFVRKTIDDGPIAALDAGGRKIRRSTRSVSYGIGSGRVCPICGWTGRKFLPSYDRSDAKCPNCSSRERHRLLWEYLEHGRAFGGPTRVLYVAPVQGLERRLRDVDGVSVITTDLDRPEVDVLGDLTSLPIDPDSIDCIICSHVLEVIPDDDGALAELSRVLKPDGEAIVMAGQDRDRHTSVEDLSGRGRTEVFGHPDVIRRYGTDMSEKLRAAGFDVVTIDYAKDIDEEVVRTYRLRESDEWIRGELDHTHIFHCFNASSNAENA